MITSVLKSLIGALSPKTLEVLRAIVSRRRSMRLERANGATAVAQKIADARGLQVQRGPFLGMRFPETLRQRGIGPKLLGTYECELYEFVSEAIAQAPLTVTVVGSAEGYYAVGLARAIPGAEVTAFDLDPWARIRCREMARLNGIDSQLRIRSFCGPDDLLALRGRRGLIVSDCEGFEYRLFTPEAVSALEHSSVIIETHPHAEGDNGPLARAFGGTHSVKMITAVPRHPLRRDEYAPHLSDAEFATAVNEYRLDGQQWLVAKPLAATA